MSKIKRVLLVFDDYTIDLEGKEAEDWNEAANNSAAWASINSNNAFDRFWDAYKKKHGAFPWNHYKKEKTQKMRKLKNNVRKEE